MPRFNVMANHLVPRHTLLTPEEVEGILASFGIDRTKLPKILISDPCVRALNGMPGDVVKIERKSPTAGTSIYYRLVVEERSVP
jgi:DNA-directed RNA polymerase subunit H